MKSTNYRSKQTKIVATISDMRCSPEFISDLHKHGMDVVRMNTAHQSIDGTKIAVANVRACSESIAILIDTKGPEVRVCPLPEPLPVKRGDLIKVAGGTPQSTSSKDLLVVTYPHFVRDIPIDCQIMIDDAYLTLSVVEKQKDYLVCKVLNDHVIKSKKSVNVPGVSLNQESLSQKDKDYIKFACENNIDFIAHSFVRNKEDVLAVQKIIDENKGKVKIISKIENQQGVDNIDEILEHSHGIMVARGDLAVEVPLAKVPMIQKMLVRKAIKKNKAVIVATQMLESMIKNPRPTRAEVSDVANAILDGASAVMLSAESASGDYPVESVKTLATIALELESQKQDFKQSQMEGKATDHRHIFARAAISACADSDSVAIICPTETGLMPRIISSFRGKWPIYAQCFDKTVMRQLALSYGVFPSYLEHQKTTDALVSTGLKQLVDVKHVKPSDVVVILGRTPGHDEHMTNFMEITQVSKALENYK
jgi:pyruvate kinase